MTASFRNYTRFVIASKVALSLLVIVLLVFVVAVPMIRNDDSGMRVMMSEAPVIKNAEHAPPTMVKPRFQSVDDREQPYMVTADSAVQTEKNGIRLNNVIADLTTNKQESLILKAAYGMIYTNQKHLSLHDDVELYHSAGHEMRTAALAVNLETFDAQSKSPVRIQGPMGAISANGFSLSDKGNRLIFNGDVSMVLQPQ